jgi:hypothetical protein
MVGQQLASDALRAYRMVRPNEENYGKWLDFGCGVGRVAVHLKRAGIKDQSLLATAAITLSGRHVRCGACDLHLYAHE